MAQEQLQSQRPTVSRQHCTARFKSLLLTPTPDIADMPLCYVTFDVQASTRPDSGMPTLSGLALRPALLLVCHSG